MTLQNIYIQVLLIMRKELRHRWQELATNRGRIKRCSRRGVCRVLA